MIRRLIPAAAIVGLVASVTACGAQSALQAEDERFMTGNFHKISHEGTLRVGSSTADGIVKYSKNWTIGEPTPAIIKEPKHLTLQRGCGNLSIGCNVDWDVKVRPRQNLEIQGAFGDLETSVELGKVSIDSIAGNITLAKTNREVAVKLGTGDVTLTDSGGAVTLSTGKGNVTIDQPAGSVEASVKEGNLIVTRSRGDNVVARSSNGNVTITVDPINTSIEAWSGAGDVTIIVPQGSTYNITAEAPSGTVREQVAHSSTGQIKVKAVAAKGSVLIKQG